MASWRTVVLLLVLLFLARGETLTEADVTQFEEFFKSKGLKLLHQNVRGLFTNFSELETLFCKHTDIDILGVTETHTNRDIPNGFFNIENYQFISRPRTTGIGGGVGVYVKNSMEWKRRDDLESESTECIWLETFTHNTKSLLIAIYYRPPNTSKHLSKNFNQSFNDSLTDAQNERKEIIVLGDLNANYLSRTDNKELKDIINVNGFKQIINKPTRTSDSSSTLMMSSSLTIHRP